MLQSDRRDAKNDIHEAKSDLRDAKGGLHYACHNAKNGRNHCVSPQKWARQEAAHRHDGRR